MPYYGENESIVGEVNENLRESVVDILLSIAIVIITLVLGAGILVGLWNLTNWLISTVIATVL